MHLNYEEIPLSEQYQRSLQEWVKLYPKVGTEQLVDMLKGKYRLSFARSWEQVSRHALAERLLKEAQDDGLPNSHRTAVARAQRAPDGRFPHLDLQRHAPAHAGSDANH